MILIIDSGSSKLDWVITQNNEILSRGTTVGNNVTVDRQLEIPKELLAYKTYIKTIYFYGSGMGSIDHNTVIRQELITIFPNLKEIELSSDLLGAARACFGNDKGIIGILGTGSNIAFYNGTKIIKTSPSLGYIIGDEGSSGAIGQEIIKAYFYNKMIPEDKLSFETHFESDKKILLKSIYLSKKPNKYIANFSRFLNFASSDLKNKVLNDVFNTFILARLKDCYNTYPNDIRFVGSIAYHYEETLRKNIEKHHMKLKSVLKSPINALVLYHNYSR